ncbi:MAG: V-type ATP synthase subunit D [Kiritimatiellaeota bacterium]|nr:V-type ATP synthase subunit D [Kiritimatiellota bacterium]
MSKIKLTKTELKAQSDALKRFQRFLPMLQLKKQQLQAEIAHITAHIESVATQEETERRQLGAWVSLFSETVHDLAALVRLDGVVTDTSNIAGVAIPVFKSIETTSAALDLFATPPWLDAATAVVTRVLSLKAERAILERQRELITDELNMTSQRVNLFEKVKIPECRENIRVIKIAIGDAQTASVSRGKIAKGRSRKAEEDAA